MRPERPGEDLPDNCKLYVAGLAETVDDSLLRSLFEPYGNVLHAAVIRDGQTGMSRNFGFVHFPDPGSSHAASEAMHGKMIENRQIIVRLRSERGQDRSSGGGGGPVHEYNEAKLYVAHLPEHATDESIRQFFSGVGPVADVKLITDKITGQSRGYAFVTMASKEIAAQAMSRLDGHMWDGSHLSIRIAGDKSRPPPWGGMHGGGVGAVAPGGGYRPPPPGAYPMAPYPGAPPPPQQMYSAPAYAMPSGMPPYPGAPPPMAAAPYPGAPPPVPYPGAPHAPYPGAPGAPPQMPYPGQYPGAMPPAPGYPGAPPSAPGAPTQHLVPPPDAAQHGAGTPPPPAPSSAPGGSPYAPLPGHPPLPGGQPPMPAEGAPPLPTEGQPPPPPVDPEYEKFMSELGR